jgi:hypothetical protein
MNLRSRCGFNLSGSRYGLFAAPCEEGNENSVPIEGGNFWPTGLSVLLKKSGFTESVD